MTILCLGMLVRVRVPACVIMSSHVVCWSHRCESKVGCQGLIVFLFASRTLSPSTLNPPPLLPPLPPLPPSLPPSPLPSPLPPPSPPPSLPPLPPPSQLTENPCRVLRPCQNGATCQTTAQMIDYICFCPIGYSGTLCDIADPTESPQRGLLWK